MSLKIVDVLQTTVQKLQALSPEQTPEELILESEILLTLIMKVSRSYLHTWPERTLDEEQEKLYFELLEKRLQGMPIAYLTGHRQFWSLDLVVTPDVLIPRPDTELLVELVFHYVQKKQAVIADLGTGSGAIALAIAHDKPNWQVYAMDASEAALNVARQNAERLNLSQIKFHLGKWCEALPKISFDAIVSNPPYIAEEDVHLTKGDLRFEPREALASGKEGLDDLSQIIQQAKSYLKPGGYLLLEHGFDQAAQVATLFKKAGYTHITRHVDFAGKDRVTIACR
jgi:release factor glutamine methyltransferase